MKIHVHGFRVVTGRSFTTSICKHSKIEPPKFLKPSDVNLATEFEIELCLMKMSVFSRAELEVNLLLLLLLLLLLNCSLRALVTSYQITQWYEKTICLTLELEGTAHPNTQHFTPESSFPHPQYFLRYTTTDFVNFIPPPLFQNLNVLCHPGFT